MPYHYGPQTVIPSPYASPVNSSSMGASITSQATIVQDMYAMSYMFVWTGTSPVGTIEIQGSNTFALNAEGGVAAAGTWEPLTLNYGGSPVTSIAITGNSGQGLVDITATGIYAIRVVYTRTSGTGTLTVTMNAKDS